MRYKVLHCITSLDADGAQRMLLKLLSHFDRNKFESMVVSLAGGSLQEEFTQSGIPIQMLGSRRGIPGPQIVYRLAQTIGWFKPDVVQGWMYHGNLAAYCGCLFSRSSASLLWNIRKALYNLANEKLLTQVVIKLGPLISRRTTRIIYCAAESAKLHEQLGYPPEKSILIPNGFDVNRFFFSSETRNRLRNELGIGHDMPVIGIVGRYHPQKSYRDFLQAAGIVHREFPEVRFVLVGRGVEPGNSELSEMVAKHQLERVVHLLGERRDVNEIMCIFDIFCLSSREEGFPNVVGEAMASEVPCVVTDSGAARELVEGLGIVVPRSNPEKLAAGLSEMLTLPKEQRRYRGRAGRARIVNLYSIENIVKQYAELYQIAAQTKGDATLFSMNGENEHER